MLNIFNTLDAIGDYLFYRLYLLGFCLVNSQTLESFADANQW